MDLKRLKGILPHLVAVLIFALLSIIYFSPVLEGKKLSQHDISMWEGMSKEISDFRAKTGEEPLWTNSMFGGMPAYQISVLYPANLLKYIDDVLILTVPDPANYLFLYMLGFYFLLVVLKVDIRLAIAGAIAFGFSSYYLIILEAGHNSKAHAIGYMAPVVASVIMAFRGRILLGAALTALFLGLQIYTNHLQITYYLALSLMILGIIEFVTAIREGWMKRFLLTGGALVIAAGLAVGANITSLWATYEYGKYTTRGPSELTEKKHSDGLDKDYALDWSYGVLESMTLIVPNFMGGPSSSDAGDNSAIAQALKTNGIPQGQAKSIVKNAPLYWGTQPFTSGPTYLGVVSFFFLILALFLTKGPEKTWLVIVSLLTLMLAWGKNFLPLTDVFFDYVPGYNKFRAVSMILVMTIFSMTLLAFLGVKKFFENGQENEDNLKALKKTFYICGGLFLVLIILPGALFSFNGSVDAQLDQWPDWLKEALYADRVNVLRMDAIRGLVIVAACAGLAWAWSKKKITGAVFGILIALVALTDHWTVDKRFVNDKDFVSASVIKNPFTPSQADQQILSDKSLDFRVMNLTLSTFNDASTSYFHKSIGGYHGAKLKRFQELNEYQLSKNNMAVLNMLNTKYFIVPDQNKNPQAQLNPDALGNAWFVSKLQIVENADEELNALTDFKPRTTAIVDKRFADYVAGWNFETSADSTGNLALFPGEIKLVAYEPNHLKYESNSENEGFAVFSEIHYEKGWNAYIDGELLPHIRVNYVLRGMRIPAGKHVIEFKFEPSVYQVGEKISMASSAILLLLVFGILFMQLRKPKEV